MALPSASLSRKVTTTHLTHRAAVLSSISSHVQSTTSQIRRVGTHVQQLQDTLSSVPEDTGSRLNWLQQQLNRSI